VKSLFSSRRVRSLSRVEYREDRGEVCTSACRASAVRDRARVTATASAFGPRF
jgi:hypothetical protein